MAGTGSYFSRIMVKSVEIMAAAVATTVSGYLIAHFSGYLTPPVSPPAAVQVAPSTATASQPAQPVQASVSSQPNVPASADLGQPRVVPAQEAAPSPPARSTVSAAPTVTPRRRGATDTGAAETKSRDAETVESRVRAALAKVDSSRSAQPAVTPRHADISPGSHSVAPSRPADVSPAPPAVAPARAIENAPGPVAARPQAVDPGTATNPPARAVDPVTVSSVPRAADPLPPPAQQAPAQSEPLTTVEIKSRPIASVDASPPPQPAPAEEEEDKGIISAIKKIPDFLRSDSHPPTTDAPRPPMPVGD